MISAEFIQFHRPALERDEIRHGLILGILARAAETRSADVTGWTLGGPGACAIKWGRHSIVLGALDKAGCRRLAEATADIGYPGVVGSDLTALWFRDRARELGLDFVEPDEQEIHAIQTWPAYPGVTGHARQVAAADADLFADWLMAFHREAVPRDPVPSRDELKRSAGDGNFLFWIDNERPVSMAGIVRRLKNAAAITGVYTPPERRGRGYAGSVTAAAVEQIHREGRGTALLYVDTRNPFSNRCYRKIGFARYCGALHFHRRDRSIPIDPIADQVAGAT